MSQQKSIFILLKKRELLRKRGVLKKGHIRSTYLNANGNTSIINVSFEENMN